MSVTATEVVVRRDGLEALVRRIRGAPVPHTPEEPLQSARAPRRRRRGRKPLRAPEGETPLGGPPPVDKVEVKASTKSAGGGKPEGGKPSGSTEVAPSPSGRGPVAAKRKRRKPLRKAPQ